MLTPEVDHWLTRFAAGAGPCFVWHLLPHGAIRTGGQDADETAMLLCPLSATAAFETGVVLAHYLPAYRAELAAALLGLSFDAAGAILGCTERHNRGSVLRARVLRICRVAEIEQDVQREMDRAGRKR